MAGRAAEGFTNYSISYFRRHALQNTKEAFTFSGQVKKN